MNMTLNTQGVENSMPGFVSKIRDWMHNNDYLAMWRCTERKILVPLKEDGGTWSD
jgi:hypothetical protein